MADPSAPSSAPSGPVDSTAAAQLTEQLKAQADDINVPDQPTYWRNVTPGFTYAVGAVFCIAVSFLAAAILYRLFAGMLGRTSLVAYIVYWNTFGGLSLTLFLLGLRTTIAAKHEGVPELFNSRLSSFTLFEGTPWLIPGLMSVTPVDTRNKTTPLTTFQVLSKDTVVITGTFSFNYFVDHPYQALSAENPVGSMIQISEAVMRQIFADCDADDAKKVEIKTEAQNGAKVLADRYDCKFGLKIVSFNTPEVRLPPVVEEAKQLKLKEQAEVSAEDVQVAGVEKRVGRYANLDKQAVLADQTERGKASTVRHVVEFGDVVPAVKAFGEAIVSGIQAANREKK